MFNINIIFGFGKLNTLLQIRKYLKSIGDYDTAISGAIGECYAEMKFGMARAKKGESAYDGYINGRKVQVKTKDGKQWSDTQHYIQIKSSHITLIDDLLMVIIANDKIQECIGPVPLSKCKLKQQTNTMYVRIYLSDMKEAMSK